MSMPTRRGDQEQASRGSDFPEIAYQFVRDGLAHTVYAVHGAGPGVPGCGETPQPDPTDESRHISGQQLCMGLRDLAIQRYGQLARTVLNHWGFTRTDDFGRAVYAMIQRGELRSGKADRMEDFQGVFDFEEAFHDVALGAGTRVKN